MNYDPILVLAALAIILAICLWFLRPRHGHHHNRAATGKIYLMSKIIQAGGTTTGTVAFQNKDGGAATVVGVPTWAVTPDGVVGLTPASDGLSADFSGTAPGTATITVTAEGDPTPGVDTVTVTATLTVVPEEASTGEITFS